MYKGMYVAMSGATLRSQELDTIANNLANASTVGYKRESFSSTMYAVRAANAGNTDPLYPDARIMAVHSGSTFMDKSEGNMRTTGNSLDLAIKGDGFFAVQGKSPGQVFYTRNGTFRLDKDNFLVTAAGEKVLDTSNNPVKIAGDGAITVFKDGTINIGNVSAGKLKLVKLDNTTHVGGSLFSGAEAGTAGGEVAQGTIEMSNVNPMIEMVGIINALREYEAAQKVITNFDTLAQRTVTEIAKS